MKSKLYRRNNKIWIKYELEPEELSLLGPALLNMVKSYEVSIKIELKDLEQAKNIMPLIKESCSKMPFFMFTSPKYRELMTEVISKIESEESKT